MQHNLSELIDLEEWDEFVSDADLRGYRLRNYSGRGMYGKECFAIVVDSRQEFAAVNWACSQLPVWLDPEAVLQDSMGTGIVVYWPDVNIEDLPLEEKD